MTSLPVFLLARLDEDEAVARECWTGPPVVSSLQVGMDHHEGVASGWVEIDPARVLADVEAKRRIVEQYRAAYADDEQEDDTERGWVTSGVEAALEQTLCLLALPYAEHPEYRAEWKP